MERLRIAGDEEDAISCEGVCKSVTSALSASVCDVRREIRVSVPTVRNTIRDETGKWQRLSTNPTAEQRTNCTFVLFPQIAQIRAAANWLQNETVEMQTTTEDHRD